MATLAPKPRPALRQIAVRSRLDAEEPISALLETLFQTPPSTAIKEGESEAVTSVFINEDDRSIPALKRTIRENLHTLEELGLGIGEVAIRIRKIRPQDWSESWKRHFRAIDVSERLLIRPPWSRRKPKKNQATVVLDPGMSFGTGNHPTTLFCLKQIAEHQSHAKIPSCLDIGTGSGILAIAAAKLGYRPVVAFDNDQDAVSAAKKNAVRNRVDSKIHLFQGQLEDLERKPEQRYNVVCANLTHDLLKAHTTRIVAQLEPEGLLCLAGILIEQFDAVSASFARKGFNLVTSETLNEWKSGAFRKKP